MDSFTCPKCNMTSHHPDDVKNRYCGNCHEFMERNHLLSDIALSALAMKLNIEHGFPPTLHALNRDLDAFNRRFGGIANGVKKSRRL